jgi:DegV family protein with EDD domain
MLTGANIENIDTLSASMGEGWPLLMAIQAAQEGKSLAECREVVKEACNYTGIILTVNTLEFLHRGGRIGGAQRLLGTALNFKPILEVNDGRIEPLERVRTRKKSLARLAELTIERVGDKRPVYMAAIHANAAQDAEQVLEVVAESLPLKARMVTSVAPTVGTHTGPGTVGIAYMAGYEYQS